jgi:hypothetical protein
MAVRIGEWMYVKSSSLVILTPSKRTLKGTELSAVGREAGTRHCMEVLLNTCAGLDTDPNIQYISSVAVKCTPVTTSSSPPAVLPYRRLKAVICTLFKYRKYIVLP